MVITMLASTFYCDECKEAKKETNKWWRIVVKKCSYEVMALTDDYNVGDLSLCSESCLIKAEEKLKRGMHSK